MKTFYVRYYFPKNLDKGSDYIESATTSDALTTFYIKHQKEFDSVPKLLDFCEVTQIEEAPKAIPPDVFNDWLYNKQPPDHD